jgi:hypothetical protein
MNNKKSILEDEAFRKLLEEVADQLDPSYTWYDEKERRELAKRLRSKSAELFDN